MKIGFNLDKRLILFVMLVAVTALSITAYLSFNYAEQILKQKMGDQLISESNIRGDSIRNLFDSRIKETEFLATDPMIRILVDELNKEPSDTLKEKIESKRRDFLTQVQAYQETVGFSIGFEDVKIIGKEGTVYFSLGRLPNTDFSQDPIFQTALDKSFVDFEPAGKDSKKMIVASPVFEKDSKRTSEPIGVIVARMRTAAIDQILLNRSGLGETGEVYLVNNGYLMLSESRFIENVVFNQRVETVPVKQCFSEGTNLVDFYPDYRGVSIYGSSYCAKDLGFILLAEIDEEETVKPIMILQDNIFQTGMLITAGMAIIAFVLAKSITRPLIKLKKAANEIEKGNFDVRTNITSGDEIGDLSHSFDAMAQKLQESLIEIKEKDSVIKQQEEVLLQFSDYSENYCVCMVDIMNSTKITSGLSDSQTSEFYRIFLNTMAVTVRNFGGIVVKNIGDALLFYFAVLPNQKDEIFHKTLDCCLTICDSHDKINKNLEEHNLPPLNFRVSGTYGPVRIARLSTSSVNDIFGSTVNRCAKINRTAPANGLIIGQEFYRGAKDLDDYNFKKVVDDSTANEYCLLAYVVTKTTSSRNT